MRQPCSRVFGRPLQEVSQPALPPKVFRQSLCFLVKNGLTVTGLFDELRNVRKIQLLHHAYDTNQEPLASVGVLDTWTVAGVLRLWLSCLPEPLIPWELAQPVLLRASQLAPEQFTSQVLTMLCKVPACNLAVLMPLTEFLHHYHLNHRDAGLAAKFLPIYLGSSGQPLQELGDAAERLVEVLITDYRSFSLSSNLALLRTPPTLHSSRSQSPSRRSRRSVRDLPSSSFLPGRYGSSAGGRSSLRSSTPGPRQRLPPTSSLKHASSRPLTLPRCPSPRQLPPCSSLLPKHAEIPSASPCTTQNPFMIHESRECTPEAGPPQPLGSQPQPQISASSTQHIAAGVLQHKVQQSEGVQAGQDHNGHESNLQLSSNTASATGSATIASNALLGECALPRLHVRTSPSSRESTQMADIAEQAITEVVGELVSASTDSLLF